MHLWSFKLRRLGMAINDRVVSTHYAVLGAQTEREAVAEIKHYKFSPEWWREHLIIEVTDHGTLWFLAGESSSS